jgi:phosphoribosylformylglycinamidine synthase subunit PurS
VNTHRRAVVAYAAWPAVPGGRIRCVTVCARSEERPGEVSKIIVEVMLKREIHDPQGEAISRACQRLGFGDVVGVRQGKRFEVELRGPADAEALTRVKELAGELLANPVIEEFALYEG